MGLKVDWPEDILLRHQTPWDTRRWYSNRRALLDTWREFKALSSHIFIIFHITFPLILVWWHPHISPFLMKPPHLLSEKLSESDNVFETVVITKGTILFFFRDLCAFGENCGLSCNLDFFYFDMSLIFQQQSFISLLWHFTLSYTCNIFTS